MECAGLDFSGYQNVYINPIRQIHGGISEKTHEHLVSCTASRVLELNFLYQNLIRVSTLKFPQYPQELQKQQLNSGFPPYVVSLDR
jgi:hypothetical protein